MKERIIKKGIIILLTIMQLFQLIGNLFCVEAMIEEGDVITLEGDHECDSLVEYWMEDYQKWSYKIVWYVYYIDNEDFKKYPAFCVEPAKEGVGTGYESYNTTLRRENDSRIWRILDKGYMGSSYQDWNLECDDDFYSATKIALHSLVEGIAPKDKYIVGTRSVDGNTVEEIRRRGEKVLNVAQELYKYGIEGEGAYVSPKININNQEEYRIETINNIDYYTQSYRVIANKFLKSYEVEIQNFPIGTKILNLQNQEQTIHSNNFFKVAIPRNQITKDIKGNIKIKNAYVKTNPIFYCDSNIQNAQNYVTYMNGYEKTEASMLLEIKANKSNLVIQKIDKETKEPIENVTFEVKDKEGNKLADITTNKKGIAEIKNLYPQEVLIKEIKVPELYVLSEEERKVKLEWEKIEKITFENEKIKGKIKINKISEDDNKINGKEKGNPIENVVFEIRDDKGEFIETITTNQEGIAISKELEKGKYIIKEVKAHEDYEITQEEFEIEIVEHQKIEEITITNCSKELEPPKLPRTGF